eukprot:TRINITY_DN98180_c1_g1_i3.p1 TRINITY_DN98180_c1_g1~~TRINITY_DN98180_c1_g1_i3.p1  ORF type:complete len:115 (+),score=14.75 TRINITY_DN98180_c1_g1_i3:170-514(+)
MGITMQQPGGEETRSEPNRPRRRSNILTDHLGGDQEKVYRQTTKTGKEGSIMLNAKSLALVSGILVGLGALHTTHTAGAALLPTINSQDDLDVLTFHDGKVVKGEILEETEELG